AFTMSIDDFAISYFNKGGGLNNLSIWLYGVLGKTDPTPSVYAFSTLMTLFTLGGLLIYQILNNKKKGKIWIKK
ncbi:MAG TPA: ABC transporter permease, partial [Bacillota bacterium]|nr:ABC transporter permease [Bacillota bacterium]